MLAVLRWKPPSKAEIGEADIDPGPDGVAFAFVGGSVMAFRDTGEKTDEGVPIFEYAV